VSFKTYVNLPVEDLEASKAFFARRGFAFSPEFSDEKAAGMVIKDGCSYAMLLTKAFFQEFLPHKAVADPNGGQCGWIEDRFGLSWQIVTPQLSEMICDPDPAKSQAVMRAMLRMKKLDLAELKRAYKTA
jgi:hypothetical protein